MKQNFKFIISILFLLIFIAGMGLGYIWGHEVGWVQSRDTVCAMIISQRPELRSQFSNA
jgi:hypothetical protein